MILKGLKTIYPYFSDTNTNEYFSTNMRSLTKKKRRNRLEMIKFMGWWVRGSPYKIHEKFKELK